MSVLSICQDVCEQLVIPSPNAIITSSDPQFRQMYRLLNKEARLLAKRWNWQALTNEATFTTVATEIQGTLSTIAPNLNFIINDTIWNRTLRRPVFGPKSPQEWQQQKAMFMAGPWNQFRIVGNSIKFIPVPAAGHNCYFEYITKAWAVPLIGSNKASFTLDEDTCLLDEDLLTLGLLWRWKASKGLEYSEDFAEYERQVTDAMGRDSSKPVLNSGDNRYDILPGVFVPSGSWNI